MPEHHPLRDFTVTALVAAVMGALGQGLLNHADAVQAQGNPAGFWYGAAVAAYGVAMVLVIVAVTVAVMRILSGRRARREPGRIALWRIQRRYRATNGPHETKGWPQTLTVARGRGTQAMVRCWVTAPNGVVHTHEFATSDADVNTSFPNGFLAAAPVRPPKLPDGEYKVRWEISEAGRRSRGTRKLRDSFEAADRPRWERVWSQQRMGERNRPVLLRWDGGAVFGIRCRVRDATSGREFAIRHQAGFPVDGGIGVLFPDGFDAPILPTPGRYEAIWSVPESNAWYGEGGQPYTDVVVHEFSVLRDPQFQKEG